MDVRNKDLEGWWEKIEKSNKEKGKYVTDHTGDKKEWSHGAVLNGDEPKNILHTTNLLACSSEYSF